MEVQMSAELAKPDPAVAEFASACRLHSGQEPSQHLIEESRRFLQSASVDLSLLEKASRAMKTLPPSGAAWMAVVIGQAIENGEGVEQSLPAVWDLFLSWLPLESVPVEPGDELPAEADFPADIDAALPMLSQSVVSHLARAPDRRLELSNDDLLLNRLAGLESLNVGICWVAEALRRSSGNLVLLHPESGKGVRVRYENVSTCFHLFTLLQLAIGDRIPGGQIPDRSVAEVVSGRLPEHIEDRAWWHYGDPHSRSPNLVASIWGEMSVRSIPTINESQVVLLWSPILADRGWNSDFFGPHLAALPASVTLERELNSSDVQLWFSASGIGTPELTPTSEAEKPPAPAERSRRRWWKLF